MVEFSETPIDKSKPLIAMINHDVMRLDISVHNTLRMAVVKSFQNFVNVEPDVVIFKTLIQRPEIKISGINILHDQGRCFSHWVSNDIDEIDDVYSATKSLQNLDLTSNFSFLNWL